MGCSSSKVENEEVVARCRARKRFLKQAVYRRHVFAASHAQYIVALKGAGSAFRQFAEGEVKDPAASLSSAAALFLPETPTTSPPVFELASRPMPLPPPPPPPMSPTISSPIVPPTLLPPLSPPHLELPSESPLPRKRASPPPHALKRPNPDAVVLNGILKAHPKNPIRANSSPGTTLTMEDKFLNPPPPPPPPVISFEDEDWSYVARAPPPPLSPPREGMPPLPPPARSSWQDHFLDPFRPLPFPSSSPRSCDEQQRQGHQPQQWRLQGGGLKAPCQLRDLHLKQLQEDIPELEDVDDDNDDNDDNDVDNDHDDVDDEEEQGELKPLEANPIIKSQPQMNVQQQQQQQQQQDDVLPTKPPEFKPKPIMKVNEEKTSKEIISVGKGKVEKMVTTVEAQKGLACRHHEKHVGRDLLEVLKEVDECFLHAAESGDKVSQMLETEKVHYHSSFSDSLKGVGESARTLNVSFRRLSLRSAAERPPPHQHRNDNHIALYSEESARISSIRSLSSRGAWTDDDSGLTSSHASTLDRLYAWEKKLYLEVKETETLRNEFEKKCAVYRNQDARGGDPLAIDRTRGKIKMLQTRLAVAIEAVESAAAAVQRLRDDELYPQLLELLEEMMHMWKEISNCHQSQMKAVEAMRRLDNSTAFEATTSSHRDSTAQLEVALIRWVESLRKLVISQREYLKSLTGWLRLSLVHFVEPERNGSQSPNRSLVKSVNSNPVYALCQQWQTAIDQMPDRVAIEAIAGFAAVVREMLRLQYEELRIRKNAEFLAHELEKQELLLRSASMRELSVCPPPLRSPSGNSGDSGYGENFDIISRRRGGSKATERWQQTDSTRRRLEEELETEQKAHIDTRAYTLNSLQTGLPFMFQALVTFSKIEFEIYERLYKMGNSRHLTHITNK